MSDNTNTILALDTDTRDATGDSIVSNETHDYVTPVATGHQLPTQVYGAMLAIWYLRPVLQRRFPLYKGRVRDFIRFLA